MIIVAAFSSQASARPAPPNQFNDKPSAPKIQGGTFNPDNRLLDMTWTRSSDDDGIAGYNVYLNGRNVDTTTKTRWKRYVKPGDKIYVTAFDRSRPKAYSNRSVEWTVGVNVLYPSDFIDGAVKPNPPRLSARTYRRNGSFEFKVTPPANTTNISGYNVYINGTYDHTYRGRYLPPCFTMKPGQTIYVTAFTGHSPPLYSDRSSEARMPRDTTGLGKNSACIVRG